MEKPIPFNTEEVKATLDGRKTMVHWPVKPQPPDNSKWIGWLSDSTARTDNKLIGCACWEGGNKVFHYAKPPWAVGDVLLVKEAWQNIKEEADDGSSDIYNNFLYYADDLDNAIKWRSSVHMPHEAARIFLSVVNVAIERLMDISEEDAKAEGISYDMAGGFNKWGPTYNDPDSGGQPDYIEAFKCLWDEIYSDKYPWVEVTTFERIKP